MSSGIMGVEARWSFDMCFKTDLLLHQNTALSVGDGKSALNALSTWTDQEVAVN